MGRTSCRSGSSPSARNIEPSYEEKRFSADDKRGRLRLIVSPNGAAGSLLLHQDARIYAGLFDAAEAATLTVAAGRKIYVHVARGSVTLNGAELAAGDALKVTDGTSLSIANGRDAEVLVFDLPAN